MTVASEITRIENNIADAYTAASGKGATLPATENSANLATCIGSISGGSSPVITSLPITPTTSAQTITAPSGTDGYNPVTVAAVTASIDANITAGNIKDGVTILGVTGNYEGSGGSYIELTEFDITYTAGTADVDIVKVIIYKHSFGEHSWDYCLPLDENGSVIAVLDGFPLYHMLDNYYNSPSDFDITYQYGGDYVYITPMPQ